METVALVKEVSIGMLEDIKVIEQYYAGVKCLIGFNTKVELAILRIKSVLEVLQQQVPDEQ